MKKTLKILMAIILFAVVLTIATSVNAAETRSYKTLEEAVQEELDAKADDENYEAVIEKVKGYYVINDVTDVTFEITDTITVSSNMRLVVNGAFTANAGIVVNAGTLTIESDEDTLPTITAPVQVNKNGTVVAPEQFGTSILNKGTMYIDGTTALTNKVTNEGTIYCEAATANVANNEQLTLKDKVTVGDVDYTKITVPVKDIDQKLTYKITKIVPENEVDSVNVIEAGKVYTVTLTASYEGKEITNPTVVLAETSDRDLVANCTVAAGNVMTVEKQKDLKGNTVNLSAQLEDVDDSKKDLAPIAIGTEIVDPEDPTTPVDPEDPTTPVDPEDPTTPVDPEQPGNTDNNGDDLDESPKTGDHIIPATALLAVVVVANVVYFAKAKRS